MTFGDSETSLPIEKLAETVSPSIWPPLFGDGKFENEAITFFHRIHCRECQRMEEQRRREQQEATSGATTSTRHSPGLDPTTQPSSTTPQQPQSPPQPVEDQSLQQTMDKNKESLKRKLLLRRSVTELVDQGIYPPLTAPAAYAEQRKHLERAKTGDLLRHKLKMRPDRQSLVQHHILEDTRIDPSLQDRQKLLKKAKLQDSLNDRLANRPGPLELVEENILQANPELKDAIIEGKLQFPKTSEIVENSILRRHFKEEPEDASASEGMPSPSHSDIQSDASSPSTVPPPPDIGPLLQSLQYNGILSPQGITLSQISSLSSPTFVTSPQTNSFTASFDSTRFSSAMSPPNFSSGSSTSSQGSNSGRMKLKKTTKPVKTQPSKRVIKFHEYKGPPNVVKNQSPPPPPVVVSSSGDTPYHILLQQQQLLLQWQLETQSKKLPIFLSPGHKQVFTAVTTTNGSEQQQQLITGQQVQVQQIGQSSTGTLQTILGQPQFQRFPTVKASPQQATTIITPVGTPIPVSTPSPAPMHSTAPPPTIVATIPACVPANAIPIYRPQASVPSVSPVVTTVVKTIVTSALTPTNVIVTSSSAKANNNNTGSRNNMINSINRPPVTKLDDLKVAELRAECRKRNLPVSGPKPNLLEKLKDFADQIVSEFKNNRKSSDQPQGGIPSVSSISSANSDNSLTSPPSITHFSNFINIEPLTPINDDSADSIAMTLGSPPMSPDTSAPELNTSSVPSQPMSPDGAIDIMPAKTLANQQVVKFQLNSSQTNVPMSVEHSSRPPSAVPMDIDLNTDLNQNPKISNSQLTKTTSHLPTTTAFAIRVPAPRPPPPPPPLPSNAQIFTIRPQSAPALAHSIPGNTPAQIQILTANQTQLRAQLLQQIASQMIRFPSSQVISQVQVGAQPGTLTIAQPRPILTQVSQPTKTVTMIPPHSLLASSANMLTTVRSSVPQPIQVTMSPVSDAQSMHVTTTQMTVPQFSIVSSPQKQILQPIGQPAVIPNDELVKRQQKTIEDMTKQLRQYQQQLEQLNVAQSQIRNAEDAKVLQQAQQQALAHTQAQAQALAQVQLQAQNAIKQENLDLNAAINNYVVTSQAQQIVGQTSAQMAQKTVGQPQVQIQQLLVQQNPSKPINAQTPSPRPASALAQPVSHVPTPVHTQSTVTMAKTITTAPQLLNGFTSNSTSLRGKTDMKTLTSLNSILQNPALHGLNFGQHKIFLTNGQHVLIASQPTSSQGLVIQQVNTTRPLTVTAQTKLTSAPLNGVTNSNNKSLSVPSSPVEHGKLARSTTNPFFPGTVSVMRDPPKYDEAMKNKQNVLLQQQSLGGSTSTSDTLISAPCTTTCAPTFTVNTSNSSSIKSEYVDDVLDILIKNGELPASAAQEPPPTPRVTSRELTHVTGSLTMSSQQSPLYMSMPASLSSLGLDYASDFLLDSKLMSSHGLSITQPSDFSISAANTVLSIANGLKLSGQFAMSSSAMPSSSVSVTTLATNRHDSPALTSSLTSPLSNHGSPHDSDSGVGSSVGRKDVSLPLSISPAISNTNSSELPAVLAESTLADFPPFMDWSDTEIPDNLLSTASHSEDNDMDTDDSKDFFKQLDSVSSHKSDHQDLNMDDFFKNTGSNSVDNDYPNLFSPQSTHNNFSHVNHSLCSPSTSASSFGCNQSVPNLRELGFGDMDMGDPNAMNIDVSDWLDVVMPPSGLTPTINLPPSCTFSADPILTPKTQEFLDLFNLVESDLYTPSDVGLTFEKAMEASSSKT